MEDRRTPAEILQLLDWKRRIFELYAEIRAAREPQAAWTRWRAVREELFRTHPQSPLRDPDRRRSAPAPAYYPYDPELRVLAAVEPAEPVRFDVPTSADGAYSFTRSGVVSFEIGGAPQRLDACWVDGYGGGLFLSFRDATSGTETYGACRYLLDTIKGADLGWDGERLVLDFNFAYNPSCSYDPSWVCPLALPSNRLPIAVRAGERLAEALPGG